MRALTFNVLKMGTGGVIIYRCFQFVNWGHAPFLLHSIFQIFQYPCVVLYFCNKHQCMKGCNTQASLASRSPSTRVWQRCCERICRIGHLSCTMLATGLWFHAVFTKAIRRHQHAITRLSRANMSRAACTAMCVGSVRQSRAVAKFWIVTCVASSSACPHVLAARVYAITRNALLSLFVNMHSV
jgi:hypothetical protein